MNSWKGRLFFLHPFNGPAQYEPSLPLYPPGSSSTRDTVPRRSPKESGGQDQRAHPIDNSTLGGLWREGGWLAWQRAQAGAGTSLTWAAACERRRGEGGTPALSYQSSGVSWWQWALRKGAELNQLQHLPFSTSTREKAALWPGPRQWPSETKVTQMQHPPHPQSNQICSLPWLPHLLSVLGPTWVAPASRAVCSETGTPCLLLQIHRYQQRHYSGTRDPAQGSHTSSSPSQPVQRRIPLRAILGLSIPMAKLKPPVLWLGSRLWHCASIWC